MNLDDVARRNSVDRARLAPGLIGERDYSRTNQQS
jgi:hypothetical protein